MLRHITIPRGPIELAADLHLPDDIDGAGPLRAVVLSTPGSSVKEQIGANQPDGPAAALDALADARTEETRAGELSRVNWLPDTLDDAAAAGLTDIDTTQAITFYRT